ncbi:DUF2971 domain-containing protein [Rhizobium leguminosarum]|uniref:DUF2971 domain-containing protein n=1 Tax=Rhizobium leguminosarum TaxID=384 RepID=UPI0013BB58AE|nr:DUF2971 domain-containing protein [Rhizobium leguminosarum]NEH46384.1 DUF2971 domain-containing protein [Rhizobium leguminosarum]
MNDGQEGFYTDDFMFDIMGIEELPATLYQYTSVESLKKILASRSLRFSRLDTMNDPEEATAADVPRAASSVFVSCWSAGEVEHIPMWSMYGRNFEGVRIKLPSNMFAGRESPMVFQKGGALCSFAGQYSIARKAPAMSTSGCAIIGPNKVWYSDDPNYRNRKLVYREGGTAYFDPYDLGMVKNTYWAYEEEWRFKIAALSFESQFPDDRYFNEVTLDFAGYPVETEALFIPLDTSALDELEVTLGPRAEATVMTDLERILAQDAPKAKLMRSQIPIR